MKNEHLPQTHQPTNAKHPPLSSSSNRLESHLVLFVAFFYPVIGCFFLYSGISDILRVLSRSETPNEFSWLVTVCCVMFAVFFITSYFMRTALQNGSIKKSVALALTVIILTIIIMAPYVFADSSLVRQFFGTDSMWLKQAILAYSSFAVSAVLFTGVVRSNKLKDRKNTL